MQPKNVLLLGGLSLFAAWCFDRLFWEQPEIGSAFFILMCICITVGTFMTWRERQRPPWTSLVLIVPVLFFAAMTFFRLEPFTQVIDVFLALGSLVLISWSWLGGRWWQYSELQYVSKAFVWVGRIIAKPIEQFFGAIKALRKPSEEGEGTPKRGKNPLVRVLWGLLLAFPLLAVLGSLLAQADPIFSQTLSNVFDIFRIENLGEIVFRTVYVILFGYLLTGAFLGALVYSRDEKLPASGGDVPHFIGWVEAVTILALVDLLFLVFVAIQFRYFFGGQANIHLDGFTYAEYARRGFGELVLVAVISLVVLLGLGRLTSRESRISQQVFSGLGVGLVALVAVMLVSAFQRLLLYEDAYGFTRIRIYTHVFMIWLGVLLVATVILELRGSLRRFPLATVLVCFGFGITLSLVNVDGLIVNQNIERAMSGSELDLGYLTSLSDDATPVLFDWYDKADNSQSMQNNLAQVLVCRQAEQQVTSGARWSAVSWPSLQTERLYQEHEDTLSGYTTRMIDGTTEVKLGTGWQACPSIYPID